MDELDKNLVALLGEAGATGLAKGIYVVKKSDKFRKALEEETSHWNFFRAKRRSWLEYPTYFLLLFLGVIVGLLGDRVIRKVINYVETKAIEFYVQNFPLTGEIMTIVEQEKHHFV
ncbi:MAG: hypothetical protein QXR57_04515 [Metallosphaera sp.]|uniref:hypothetical protein n=1 Tax=Metallosphaera TaxID=41980 RepID=UPI000AEBF8D2|nr:hypothetical protein [Metallosphaera cuprina]